jgi:hypothetical protein
LKLRFLAQCFVSICLLAFLVSRIEWRELLAIWQRVNGPTALAASGLTFVLILLLAVRWRIFLRQQGIASPFSTILRLTWTGQFFNSFLPGSTGGDVSKIYQLCRRNPSQKPQAAASVVLDRISALIAMVVMAGFAAVLGPSWKIVESGLVSINHGKLLGVLVVASGIAAGIILYRLFGSETLRNRWVRVKAALGAGLRINTGTLMALLLAFLIHFLNFTIFFLFARALGISITYWQVLLIMPVVFLLLLLPVTVNGHGLREILLIFYFTEFGIRLGGGQAAGVPGIVVSLTLICVANDLLWCLPGGLLCLVPTLRPRI